MSEGSPYALRFDVDYPDRDLSRLKTFFRLILLIPIVLLLALVEHVTIGEKSGDAAGLFVASSGILFAPVLLMLLFRKKYPRWWFDWNVELTRFAARVGVYAALMNDEYPSTTEQQSVHLDIDYPDAENGLSRGMPLVKWFLSIPHYIILIVLTIVAALAVIGAWFAILFTGRYPRSFFNYVVGVHRWALRVNAYAFLLVTDRYPPFSLDP